MMLDNFIGLEVMLLKNLSTFSDKTLPFVIPNYRVIDIDDNED